MCRITNHTETSITKQYSTKQTHSGHQEQLKHTKNKHSGRNLPATEYIRDRYKHKQSAHSKIRIRKTQMRNTSDTLITQ